MSYSIIAFISVLILALVHVFANKSNSLSINTRARFLSLGGGVAIAYVFVDLLPKLAKGDLIVRMALAGIFPYFERHVYVIALTGFLLFFIVDRSSTFLRGRGPYLLALSSYTLFNFLVGYAVVNKDNPEVQPLALFTFAIGLHYFTNDYSLTEAHGDEYQRYGRWLLVAGLFCGWFVGLFVKLSPAAIALVSAFIGGGVIMNVTRHELPKDNPNSLSAFLISAFAYTSILLMIG